MIKKILITTTLALGMLFVSNIVGINYFSDTVMAATTTTTAPDTTTTTGDGSSGGSSSSLKEQACLGAGGTFAGGECTGPGDTKLEGEDGLIKKIINTLLFVIGAASVIIMIYGGLRYVLSAGDTGKVTEAKNTIIYAAIGLVVAFLAYAIVTFVINAIV
jgi:hypothetical protein